MRSLYDRLWGLKAFIAVTDAFVVRAGGDDRISRKFAHSELDRLKKEFVEQLWAATGGPSSYTGRQMTEAHAGMAITAGEFDAFIEDIRLTLDDAGVPKADVLTPPRSEIVAVDSPETGTDLTDSFHPAPPLEGMTAEHEIEEKARIATGLPVSTITHEVRRLAVPLRRPYAEAVRVFEETIPVLDRSQFVGLSNWDAVVAKAEEVMPLGFLRFWSTEVPPYMVGSGFSWDCTEYLMGNHVIAEQMYRYNPTVMMYAPLRLLIQADENGDGVFVIDQPSTLFASFGDPRVAEVGRLLDAKLAGLFTALGVQAPAELSD
jgi:truncated hemoglobin YjbI